MQAPDDLALLVGSKKATRALLSQTTEAHLASASLDELTALLPERAARRLYAAAEFIKRALRPAKPLAITEPRYGVAHVTPHLQGAETERMVVVVCDARLKVKHTEVVAVGGTSTVAVTPGDILTPVIRHRAAAFFVAHNHPSGDPTPSRDDIRLTEAVFRAAAVMGITFLDHLVIAEGGHASIRELVADRDDGRIPWEDGCPDG